MKPILVDSHCHLNYLDLEKHQNDLSKAITAAHENHVQFILCPGVKFEEMPDVLAIADEHVNVFAGIGVHPNEKDCIDPSVDEIIKHGKHPRVVAIGETGLDYYRCEGDLTWQHDRFRRHIQAATELDKPLIIHTRQAREDTVRILKEENANVPGAVIHCFTEDWSMAKQCLDLGFYISFSGIVTFKNAKEIQEVAKKVPMDRMLVETDAPYLTPTPYRGKTNEPAYVRHVAEFIAELRDIPFEEVAKATTDNFHRLFQPEIK